MATTKMTLDKKTLDKIKTALNEAGLGDLLVNLYVDNMLRVDKDCPYGCSACCDQGSANRKAN